jgi:hypothetical protein
VKLRVPEEGNEILAFRETEVSFTVELATFPHPEAD